MISHEHRAIFIHIQKTGGSSINRAFGWDGHLPHKHFRADQLRPIYGEEVWTSHFKFAFVRNPWDRLVSWWAMIDGRRSHYLRGQRFNGFQDYVLGKAGTFHEFLHLCIDEIKDSDGDKSILRNQIDYLVDSNAKLMVDYIGRFETIAYDFNVVAAEVGLTSTLPHVNASSRTDYRRYFTDDLAALVAQRYARDIAAFGYQF